LNSSFAAALYLSRLGFKKKVYVIGQDGITDELKEVGIESYGGAADSGKSFEYEKFAKEWKLDPEVQSTINLTSRLAQS
jgi:ribonucleotide monophosphatase NagD (HAD superfamily)